MSVCEKVRFQNGEYKSICKRKQTARGTIGIDFCCDDSNFDSDISMETAGDTGLYFCIIRSRIGSMSAEFTGLVSWNDTDCTAFDRFIVWKWYFYIGMYIVLHNQYPKFSFF